MHAHDSRLLLPVALAVVTVAAACRLDDAPARAVEAVTFRGDIPGRAPDEQVLDVNASGVALVARADAPLPDSDADRALTLRVTGAAPYDAGRALDARLTRGGLVALELDHTLVLREGARLKVIDRGAYGPLSLSDDRRRVLYTRGLMPALEVYVADLDTGRVEAVAPGVAPAWCPAWVGPRGIAYVASPEGRPSLYWHRDGRAPARIALPEGAPFPMGPTAPVVVGDTLLFEGAAGLHTLSLADGRRSELAGLSLPVRWPGAKWVLGHRRVTQRLELTPVVIGGAP